jgi:hypothetical protein
MIEEFQALNADNPLAGSRLEFTQEVAGAKGFKQVRVCDFEKVKDECRRKHFQQAMAESSLIRTNNIIKRASIAERLLEQRKNPISRNSKSSVSRSKSRSRSNTRLSSFEQNTGLKMASYRRELCKSVLVSPPKNQRGKVKSSLEYVKMPTQPLDRPRRLVSSIGNFNQMKKKPVR